MCILVYSCVFLSILVGDAMNRVCTLAIRAWNLVTDANLLRLSNSQPACVVTTGVVTEPSFDEFPIHCHSIASDPENPV